MKLEIASAKDNKELLAFYSQFHLPGSVELKVDRGQDFFAPYRVLSEDFRTYILRDNSSSEIQALASFVFRDAFTGGSKMRIALAKDLRVAPNRRAVLNWAHHFLPVMQEVIESQKISHIFSYINLSDPTALNAFVRARPLRRPLPRYFLYRKINLVSLHGRFPWAPKAMESLRIRRASAATEDALIAYLVRRLQYRPFASLMDHESFHQQVNRLKGLSLKDFFLAFDAQENVVGCLASWSPASIEKFIPISYSLRGHNFRQFIKYGRFVGIGRPLTKPVASTGKEAPLQFRYLSFLAADNEDIFESLINVAFDEAHDREFLIYAHSESDFRLRPPRHWLAANHPYALYAVMPPGSETPSFLSPTEVLNPEVEAYSVI